MTIKLLLCAVHIDFTNKAILHSGRYINLQHFVQINHRLSGRMMRYGCFIPGKVSNTKQKLAVILMSLIASATTSFAQPMSLGLRAGVNFAGDYQEYHDKLYSSRLKTGFNAGFNTEIPVGSRFFVQPGLLFSTKGSIDYESTTVIRLSYVELPVNLILKASLGNGKLLLGAGPYFAAGVAGSYTDRDSNRDFDVDFDDDITWEQAWSPTIHLKRFDTGVNFLVGYEFANEFTLQLNGQLGLVNTSPTIDGEHFYYNSKSIGFGFSVGYRFQ